MNGTAITTASLDVRDAALPPTTTGLVLFQRWWTRPAQGQTRLRPADQVQRGLLAALLNSSFDIRRGDGDDEE